MKPVDMKAVIAFGGAVAVAAASASATSVFTDRPTWASAAADAGIGLEVSESFEDFPSSDSDFFPSIDANGFTVSSVDVNFDFLDPLTVQDRASGGQPTDGDQLLSVSALDFTETTFAFDNPVTAVGLDLIDFGDFGGQASTIVATLSSGEEITIFDGIGVSGNQAFFGVITDAPIDSIVIRNNFDGDQYGIDNVQAGIPTPGAAGLLGVAGLASVRRRR